MRVRELILLCALASGAAFAAQPAPGPNGANPSDIATPKAADGAIIDKTRPASGAAGRDPRFLQHAQKAASAASAPVDGRKRIPARPSASSAR